MANEMPVPPQQPIVTYFDPNRRDLGLVEIWSTERATDQSLDIGTPHPNTRDYPGYKLGLQAMIEGDDSWMRRVWVTDETNPDWFNYEIKFAAEAIAFPTYVRQYRLDKKTYTPLTKGIPLGSISVLKLLTAGSGYVVGTFPAVTFTGGGGSGATGHAIVNLDGTLADVVLDAGGSGYTTLPTATIDDPPIGVAGTALAIIQPQTAVLIAEQAEEFPKNSEFFGLYFNVTRVYETLPGPTLETTQIEEDGMVKSVTHTRKVETSIVSLDDVDGGFWIKTTKKETGNLFVGEEVIESRPLPGNPIAFTRLDDDGVTVFASRTMGESSTILSNELFSGTTWIRTFRKEITDKVGWQIQEARQIPGPEQEGEQTGKWGPERVFKQKVRLSATNLTEGYAVKESKFEPIEGSDLVGTKVTVFYPPGLYGVALCGQDYDKRLNVAVPYVEKLQPMCYGVGTGFDDVTPQDYEHALVHTIDPDVMQDVLEDYEFSYPGRINIDLPDMLIAVYGFIDGNQSDAASQETGANTFTGAGSISQDLSAQAQGKANVMADSYPVIKQFWGNNIACTHIHFFLENPVTQADVLARLNDILSPDSVSDWPKFNPELVTLIMTGGGVSALAKARSQGSYSLNGTGETSTAGGGTGYSIERGLTVRTMRISPTIHSMLTVLGDVYGTESVSATAYAEAAGLGPFETQTTGPLTCVATVTPTSIPATVGSTTWPVTGKYLYRVTPNPYGYGFIEFHCVVVDADDFPNVP